MKTKVRKNHAHVKMLLLFYNYTTQGVLDPPMLETDASKQRLGVILSQLQDDSKLHAL